MTLAVLPDNSVLHTSRDGTLRLTDVVGNPKISGKVPVCSHDEENATDGHSPTVVTAADVTSGQAPLTAAPAATSAATPGKAAG